MKLRIIALLATLLAIAAVTACSGDKAEKAQEKDDDLAAKVGDWTITKQRIEETIAQMAEAQRVKYDNPAGRAEITDRFIGEELFFREAKKLGYEDRDAVKAQIDDAVRHILVAEYFHEFVEKRAEPAEQEVHDYYETNQDRYTTLETIRAQHIFAEDKATLEDLKKRIVEGGENFTTMAHRYSEDKLTQVDGGDLGFFNPGGYIRGVGFSTDFNDALAAMETKQVYGPVKWERGYSLVRVNARVPAQLRPYDEVRPEIVTLLTQQKINATRDQVLAETRAKHIEARNFFREYYETVQRSPKELFGLAQTSDSPANRLQAYEELVTKFPGDELAPKALFMVGFVYAEEMSDVVSAGRAFQRVVDRYPDSEEAQMAQWMLSNMDKSLPKFEDMDDIKGQMGDGKTGKTEK